MSVQAMSWVLDHSRAENAARLVMISLANHASVDGSNAYPSISTIAREARCGESTVRHSIKALIALGEIEDVGTGPRGTNCFRINMVQRDDASVRVVRPRPGQRPPHERSTPAGSAAPQDLRPPAGSALKGAQDLRTTPAGSAAEPSLNRPLNLDSPVVDGRAGTGERTHDRDDLAEFITGILQRAIDSLTGEQQSKQPTAAAIRATLEATSVDDDRAVEIAQETRAIAQSQNRAPNIAGLYAQRMAQAAAQPKAVAA